MRAMRVSSLKSLWSNAVTMPETDARSMPVAFCRIDEIKWLRPAHAQMQNKTKQQPGARTHDGAAQGGAAESARGSTAAATGQPTGQTNDPDDRPDTAMH